ncbi:MAG: ATP-binding protein [Anaeroplasma sp.]|uniref:ATP-binding protein n=1 Tax=Anaeroplasma sp. TaxID=1872523 RepID=UPI002A9186CC|nr:ATP-binding protein [Anaeroplasma sp.]MDY5982204.1 ATP-binding protein [Anaeroplasma sp.]
MFYGRKKEINLIKSIFNENNKAILIYGKRRVGKTTLIKEAIKEYDSIYFECLEDTIEKNIESFKETMIKQGVGVPSYISFKDFIDVFSFLDSLNKKYVVVIDEYPYFKSLNNPSYIDSMFQNVIDNHIKNLNLIISGSSMKIMNEILKGGNALFGRFKETLLIEEFNYLEASTYYYNDLTPYDKVAFYSVFGGSPYINESINPKISLKDNIINTFLKNSNNVYNYADNLLLSDSSNKIQAKRIISTLGNSKKKYSELESLLDKEKTGKINVPLKSLIELKLVSKVFPINKPNDSKKSFYEIKDNAIRFFYTYVYTYKSNLEILGSNAFYDEFIKNSLNTYVSHRFEDVCRTYFSLKVKNGNLKGIRNIGTYYYDDSVSKQNGEFDVAIETSNGFDIYEVKYLKKAFDIATLKNEFLQIKNIKGIKVNNIGFISVNGFDFNSDEYELIDGSELFKTSMEK